MTGAAVEPRKRTERFDTVPAAVWVRQRDLARRTRQPVHRTLKERRQTDTARHGQGHRRDPCAAPARAQIDHLRPWHRVRLMAAPAAEIGTRSWFCDPSAPWQKGTVENTNGRARRWLFRERYIGKLSDPDFRDRLNATACKCLGGKSPPRCSRPRFRKRGRERPAFRPPRCRRASIA